MTSKEGGGDSVGQAKSLPFGAVLRWAIKDEFGTGKEFAAKLGVNESRVSQLLAGAESLTAQTLDDTMRCFSGLEHQQKLHDAWVSTFAPSPLESLAIREVHESTLRLLQARDLLAADGRAREALKALKALRCRLEDQELSFELDCACVELSLFLGRSTRAREACTELVERAKRSGETAQIAQALWLMGNVMRNAPATTPMQIVRAHETAYSFAAAWKPVAGTSKQSAAKLRKSLIRDRALTVLALNDRGPVPHEQLFQVGTELDKQLAISDFPEDTKAVFLEVKGRALLAQGETMATEAVLEEASQIHAFVSPDHSSKAAILKGQLLLRRQLPDQAAAILNSALDTCYELDNLHHAHSIERILGQVSH